MPALLSAAIKAAAIAPALVPATARNRVAGLGQHQHRADEPDPLDPASFEGQVGHQLPPATVAGIGPTVLLQELPGGGLELRLELRSPHVAERMLRVDRHASGIDVTHGNPSYRAGSSKNGPRTALKTARQSSMREQRATAELGQLSRNMQE